MVRFGIVGTGWITDEFIRGASENDNFVLSAIYSRTADRAKAFAEKYSIPYIFTDLETMAQSKLIDAVYIASPNSCHAQQSAVFLQNNKHVLCEKPIASNSRELITMINTARGHRVVLMEALKTGFLPNFQVVKDNLHKIGTVRRFLGIKCQYSSRYDAFKQGVTVNTFDPAFSNGSLMDIGVYCIYPAVYLFGRPNHVQASAVMLDSGVDGEGHICLGYGGMDALLVHSKIANSTLASEVQGEKGTILIDKISTPTDIKIVYLDGSIETLSQQQTNHSMYYEAREFIDIIQNRQLESKINSYQTATDVMQIMDTVRREIGLVFPADRQ